jgi:dihydrofolate reductase
MIAIVLAMTRKGRVIGKDNKMLWHIPSELKHFRALTKGGVVIMGRKTYDSLEMPLPHRVNIVVSRSAENITGCEVARSLQEAVDSAKKHHKPVFIIGGAQIAKQALDLGLADTMLLSYINSEYEGDAHFPAFDESGWRVERREDHGEWEFVVYRRTT